MEHGIRNCMFYYLSPSSHAGVLAKVQWYNNYTSCCMGLIIRQQMYLVQGGAGFSVQQIKIHRHTHYIDDTVL